MRNSGTFINLCVIYWSIPLPNAAVPVLMYFPEYNAILVPAESISPDYLPSSKRKKPIRGLVRLIKERMEGASSSENDDTAVPTESNLVNTIEKEGVHNESNDTKPFEELFGEKPTQKPVKLPEDSQTQELQPTEMPAARTKEESGQPHTFGPFAQIFQRPNNKPVLGNPEDAQPVFGQDASAVQPSRPTFVSYLPPGVTSYFQNPSKLPFATFFENRFPFFAPSSAPRNPYVHYYTKTPTSEAFYYNSLHPTFRHAAYSDAVQSEISEYVNQIQQSLYEAQAESSPSTTNSAMMVASVPMGKNQATSLVLRPVAKAVAGPKGVAVASPVAKAVLRRGEKVDIDFDPDAVAIAGPGGQAHAHPKLIISYTNENGSEEKENTST